MADKTEYIISLKDLFSAGVKDADKAAKGLDSTVSALKITMAAAAVAAGYAMKQFAEEIFDTTLKMDSLKNSLNFISGGQGKATFEYLRKESDLLGLSLEASAKGFKQIAGASRGTNLEGQKTKDIFEGVSMATSVMGLSAEESEGALLALSQMISKGKVQAEELRGQLGERLPGAFQIAARSMGMTTKALDKFMSNGNLIAEDFLPKFANELKKEFASGIPVATQSLQAQTNRLRNEYLLLKMQIGEELRPVMVWFLNTLKGAISLVKDFIDFIKKNAQAIKNFAVFISILAGEFLIWKGILIAIRAQAAILFFVDMVKYVALTQGLTNATAFLSIAQAELNTIMAANPIGIVVLALAALGAAIYSVIQKYQELDKMYKVQQENFKTKAIDEETKSVLALAAANEKNNKMTKEMAQAVAIGTRSRQLDRQIETLKAQQDALREQYQVNPDDPRFETQLKGVATAIEAAKARKSILNKDTFSKMAGTETITKVDTGTDKVKGPEHKVITINIDKLVEKLSINTTNMIEGAAQTKEMMVKALLEALNDAQIVNPI